MSGTVFLPCWLVGLSFPTLDPKGCIGRDWALVSMNTPQHPCHQCPCPHSELQVPLASPGDPPRPAGRSGPGSYEVTPFPTGSQGTWDLCALWEWHLFPPVLWSSPAGLQSQMLWGLIPLMPDPPAWGAWHGLGTHSWENLCDPVIFQFLGHPSMWSSIHPGTGFDYIMSASLLQSCCGLFFVFGSWTSLLVGSGSGLLMVVQYSVVILVFSWEEVSSGPSVPPSCQEIKKLLIFKLSFLLGFLCLPMWKTCFYNKEMLHLYTAYILFKL